MTLNITKLKEKYPKLEKEIDKIGEVYDNLTLYFASIYEKGEITQLDMFFKSVVNRTNQCLFASTHCLLEDLPVPLVNVIRQLIEIYAVNEYIASNPENFKKAMFGKHLHENPDLKLPNIKTLVEKIKEKEIIKLYNEYCEVAHPNSKSVFSVFKMIEDTNKGFIYGTSSYNREINSDDAYHLIRNIAGLANRVYLSSKKINPLAKYVTIDELKRKSKK